MTAVLGGGVSGLAVAHYMLKVSNYGVFIIEGSNTLGGWIKSINYPKEGFVFEKGPHTVRPTNVQGLATLSLVDELKLGDKVQPIVSSHPSVRNRLIYANNKLHRLPAGFSEFFKPSPPFTKSMLRYILAERKSPKVALDDESIYSFVERRFGKELADYAISSLVCGVCAGDAKEISVKFILAEAFKYEQKYGSVVKGVVRNMFTRKRSVYVHPDTVAPLVRRAALEKWRIWSLNGGLQQLPEALVKSITEKGARFRMNSVCKKLEFRKDKAICVTHDPGKLKITRTFDHIICSLPASTVAELVSDQHPKLSQELAGIKHASVAVVNIAYRGQHLKHEAFGLLVPPKEKLPILGIIFDSCNFGYKDWTVLTVMMGGKWYDEYFGSSATDQMFLEVALIHVGTILNINVAPNFTHVSVLKDCIPQYTVGHYSRVDKIMSYIKEHKLPFSLIGSSYHGIGVNDVIYSAKRTVDALYQKSKPFVFE